MSWAGLGWKRSTEVLHLTLSYGQDVEFIDDVSPTSSMSSSAFSGSSPTSPEEIAAAAAASSNASANQDQLGFKIDLEWNAADDEDQVALKLQSQVMVALPTPQDAVEIDLTERAGNENPEGDLENEGGDGMKTVGLEMRVVKRREPLKGIMMWKPQGSGQQNDGGMGVLVKLMRSNFANGVADGGAVGSGCADHWRNVSVVSLCNLGLYVSHYLLSD